MKKILTLFVLLLISVISFAQNPKLNFQAVVRDSENKLVVEQPVTVTVNVLDAANASQFEQTLNATTNRNGLMSLEIGDDTPNWNNINWNGAKIRTAVTFDGTEMVDTTMVSAVPSALYAPGTTPFMNANPALSWASTPMFFTVVADSAISAPPFVATIFISYTPADIPTTSALP